MTGQKWIWQVRTDQVRSEVDMTGKNRSGQVRSGHDVHILFNNFRK
jgi:hypothetical protein